MTVRIGAVNSVTIIIVCAMLIRKLFYVLNHARRVLFEEGVIKPELRDYNMFILTYIFFHLKQNPSCLDVYFMCWMARLKYILGVSVCVCVCVEGGCYILCYG